MDVRFCQQVLLRFGYLRLMKKKTHKSTAETADDVCHMGNVVCGEEACCDLLGYIERTNRDQGNGNFAPAGTGCRGEENEHINDTAGSEEHCIGCAENQMKQRGNDGSNGKHDEDADAAPAFFNNRTEGQNQSNVGDIMCKG